MLRVGRASRVPQRLSPYYSIRRPFWWGGDDNSNSSGDSNNKNNTKEKTKNSNDETDAVLVGEGSERQIVPQFGESTPKLSPLICVPIVRRPVFPGFFATHLVKDEKTVEAIVENRSNGASYMGLFLRTDGEPKDESKVDLITSMDQIHNIGTFAQIHNVIRTPRGAQLLLMAHRRIGLDEITAFGPPTIAKVTHLKKQAFDAKSPSIKAYSNEVIAAVRELLKINPVAQEHIHEWASRMDFSDPFKLADFAASITSADGEDLQRVMAALDVEERLGITLELLNKEKEVARVQKEISEQVEKKVSKQQREYMLREQLKTINKELGIEKDDKEALITKYRTRVEGFHDKVHKDTLTVINDEIDKMSRYGIHV